MVGGNGARTRDTQYANKKFSDETWGPTCFGWLQETIPSKKAGRRGVQPFYYDLISAERNSQNGYTTKVLHRKRNAVKYKPSLSPFHAANGYAGSRASRMLNVLYVKNIIGP